MGCYDFIFVIEIEQSLPTTAKAIHTIITSSLLWGFGIGQLGKGQKVKVQRSISEASKRDGIGHSHPSTSWAWRGGLRAVWIRTINRGGGRANRSLVPHGKFQVYPERTRSGDLTSGIFSKAMMPLEVLPFYNYDDGVCSLAVTNSMHLSPITVNIRISESKNRNTYPIK